MGFPYAAGAMYSTVGDLFLWDRALSEGRLLSAESRTRMNAITPLISNYGYGVKMGRQFGRRTIEHAGGINGFRSNFVRFPDEQASIVVLGNTEESRPGAVSTALAAILFGEKFTEQPVKGVFEFEDAVAARYVGSYEVVPGVVIDVVTSAGRLVITCGNARRQFIADSESTFFGDEDPDSVMTMQAGEGGRIISLTLRQDDIEMVAARMPVGSA
jgi:hypothetical protein